MKKTTQNKAPANSPAAFFAKPYILGFAAILLCAAAIKFIFTISTTSVTGVWKTILVTDTITSVLSVSSLFLFYMSGTENSLPGLKIASIAFLLTSVSAFVVQFFVLSVFATYDNILILLIAAISFGIQAIFQIAFSVTLTRSVFKNTFLTTGAVPFAAVKAASLVTAALIYAIKETSIIKLEQFRTAAGTLFNSDSNYPTIAFCGFIATSLALTIFALLYNKYATDLSAKEETEQA